MNKERVLSSICVTLRFKKLKVETEKNRVVERLLVEDCATVKERSQKLCQCAISSYLL
jgi:hypothetical protein